MEITSAAIDEKRIDALGAHFKYQDLTKRLKHVIQDHRQDKRSADLLAYQLYFT